MEIKSFNELASDVCVYCSGSGVVPDFDGDVPCSACDGTGRYHGKISAPTPFQGVPALGLGQSLPKLATDRQHAANYARELAFSQYLILDTETTGLGEDAEICEISVISDTGLVVFNSLIKPTKEIPQSAIDIHGITNEMVRFAPSFADIAVYFDSIFWTGCPVIIYNADFDERIIRQTARISGLCEHVHHYFSCSRLVCLMRLYAQFVGQWNSERHTYKWHKLVDAAKAVGFFEGDAHRAIADCRMAHGVLRVMASYGESK